MNYIKELNAFYDWLETNSLSTSAIALWHALMHICNKCGWAEEFGVAISTLSVKTGLSRRGVQNARNELQQKGRIKWRSRGGNKSAVYTIIPLTEEREQRHEVKKVDNDELAQIVKLYESGGFGQINLLVKEVLEDLLDEFGFEWVSHAIKVAVKRNKRNLSYVRGILNNWKNNGGITEGGKPGGTHFGGTQQNDEYDGIGASL